MQVFKSLAAPMRQIMCSDWLTESFRSRFANDQFVNRLGGFATVSGQLADLS